MANCKINISPNGDVQVKGENASLFYEASLVYGNDIDALDVYGVSITDGFLRTNLPATLSNVLRYAEQYSIDIAPEFSNKELREIYSTMGYENFLEATTVNGEFELDRDVMSKFYTPQEIDEIMMDFDLINNLKKVWVKMQKNIEYIEQYEVTPAVVNVPTGETNLLGKTALENPDKVYTEIGKEIAGKESLQEIEEVIFKSTNPIVQEAEASVELLEEFRGKQALQQYIQNPITGRIEKKKYNSTKDRLLHTYNSQENTESLQSEVYFLLSIDEDVLEQNMDSTKDILYRVEEKGEEVGIELNGIAEATHIPTIKQFLMDLGAFLNSPVEEIDNFSESYNKFFKIQEVTSRPVIEEYKGKGVMKIETTLSEAEMFQDYSVIKISENNYKKVNRNIEDVYEEVYKKVLENPLIFNENIYYPFGFDKQDNIDLERIRQPKYKPQVKKAIKEALEKEVGEYQIEESLNKDTIIELVAFKKAFGSDSRIKAVSKETYYNTFYNKNAEEFIEKFLKDVNKHIIHARGRGETIPLTFTQKGLEIEYTGEYSAIDALYSLPKNLQDRFITYSKLTNNNVDLLKMFGRVEGADIEGDLNYNRNFYSNFPHQLPLYKGEITTVGQGTVKLNSVANFVRLREGIYEKVGEVYSKLPNQGDFLWGRRQPKKVEVEKTQTVVKGKKIIKSSDAESQNIDKC